MGGATQKKYLNLGVNLYYFLLAPPCLSKSQNLEIEVKVKQLGGKRGDTMLIYDNELTLD